MTSSPATAFDLVITGGDLLDGSGAPAVRADLAVSGGRVAAIGDLSAAQSERRMEAAGRIVAPGFVDIHGHSDFTLLVDPEAQSALAQGVTTEVVGNCGHGPAPIGDPADPRFSANIYGWAPDAHPMDWRSMAGYLDALDAARPAINVATLVPLGNLRLLALDDVSRPAASHELAAMARELEAGLDVGAVGLSMGLEYPAEGAASGGELDALASIVARRGGLCAIHTRDRGMRVVDGTHEAIEIARATGVRAQVAHILARRGSGPPDANRRITAALDAAVADGLPIAWDVHTRLFGITNLSIALAGSLDDEASLRVGPADPGVIASFGRAGWDRTFILDAPGHPELAATSVAERAAAAGVDAATLLREVLRDAAVAGNVHQPLAIGYTYDEDDIAGALAASSRCGVASDGTTMNLGGRLRPRLLPGAFTWAAWYLRRLVGERGLLPTPEAIRRITSLPAAQAGLRDRGRLAVGARADVVVFDPARLREPDVLAPASLAVGVDLVLVNGASAWEAGRPTGVRAGEVIRA